MPFPESSGAVNTYPIAVLKGSTNAAAAQKFVDLVTGPQGQEGLGGSGFRCSVTRRTGGLIQVGLPTWVYLPAAVGALFVIVPLVAILLKIDWAHFIPLVTSESSRAALLFEPEDRRGSTAVCVLLGVPMALVLARGRFPGQSVLRAVVLLPLVLPPVVGGIALLYTFGRQGLLGPSARPAGHPDRRSPPPRWCSRSPSCRCPSWWSAWRAHCAPQEPATKHIAATLGARPTTVLRTVTLPLVLPGLMSGAVLAFARSLGEFGATLTFAGSLQGVTRTLPLEIYLQRETDPDAAVALSLLLIVVAAVIVIASAAVASAGPL